MNIWKITDTNKIQRTEIKVNESDSLIKVRVARAGLTETDFAVYSGTAKANYPIIPSKTAVGLISDADNPLGLKVGERVLLSAYTPCGECAECSDESHPYCSKVKVRGIDENGFLSDFAYVDKSCVYPVPESVSDTECLYYDYIAVSLAAMQKMKIEKGEYVAILGGDVQSMIFAEVVNYYQAIPILISKLDSSVRLASQNGIDYTVNSKKYNMVDKVFEITGGKMAEHVVYSVYSGESSNNLFSLASPNGSVGIIGYNNQRSPIESDLSNIISNQLNVYGIKEGSKEIMSAINMLAMKAIHVDMYQTSKVSFASVENIFGAYKPGNNPGLVIVDCNDA